MTDHIKILIVATCLAMGGIERAAVNTANGFCQYNADVIFLSLFKKPHFFNLNSVINLVEPSGFNINSLNFLKSIVWIRAEVKKNRPTHILVFNKLYGAITALALVGFKIPLFVSERSSPLFKWSFRFRCINRVAFAINPPQGVIAQTQIAADYQKKYFKYSKIKVIPNSVREVKLYPEINRKPILLAVGRLNDHLKGFDLLLESIALLKNNDWELHIAGGDENGEVLKKQAERLSILHRVKFLGTVKDIDLVYASASIFVIPSRSEGFPNALVEAMAAGCCCVSFDFVAGPRDLIKHELSGVIVPAADVRAMANALDCLINDSNKRAFLGENAMLVREKLKQNLITNMIKDFILKK